MGQNRDVGVAPLNEILVRQPLTQVCSYKFGFIDFIDRYFYSIDRYLYRDS